MENTRAPDDVVDCSNPMFSKYYLIIVQVCALRSIGIVAIVVTTAVAAITYVLLETSQQPERYYEYKS